MWGRLTNAVFDQIRAGAFIVVASVLPIVLSPEVYASPVDTFCTPDQVLVWTSAPRLHVRCAATVGGIKYFAVSTADTAQAARVLSVINAALIAGRTLIIRYDPADLSGAAIGCLTQDCRLIQGIGFGK